MPAAVSTSQRALPKMPNGVAKPASAPFVDLLDLSSDITPEPSSSGGDFLHDLLGVDLSPTLQGWFCIIFDFQSSYYTITFLKYVSQMNNDTVL